MAELLQHFPQDTSLRPDLIFTDFQHRTPDQVLQIARYVSGLADAGSLNTAEVLNSCFSYIEGSSQLNGQLNSILFLVSIDKKPIFSGETLTFLSDLRKAHNFQGDFPPPFQKFVNERIKKLSEPRAKQDIGDTEDTKKVLDLLQQNGEFLGDVLDLQQFFTANISPVMPLNATWNPALTRRFGERNATGLWYVYSHGFREEYLELMKKHLSPEWTGFNRFAQEPWEALRDKVKIDGHLVDIGSSIGITAMEIAQTLGMQGPIILLDSHNPHRDSSSLRVIDYSDPRRRLIPFEEAIDRMELMREEKVVMQLFGVDIGQPLLDEVQGYLDDASLVHMGNILPYIQPENLYDALRNAFTSTSENGGVLRIHNDANLPIDSVITSLTIQRQVNQVSILRDLTKARYSTHE